MIYEHLFHQHAGTPLRAGLIGTGVYGLTLLAQARYIDRLTIPAVCDRDVDAARQTCEQAGIPAETIVICANRAELLHAIEQNRCAIVEDGALLMDTPLDIIVECTGDPDAGASYAEAAIQHGHHVAMVNKQTDAVIGPVLRRLAEQAGVIYTQVDGDQHGLLIGLVSWAQALGLAIVCGGKARPWDFVYDQRARTVAEGSRWVGLSELDMAAFRRIQAGEAAHSINERRRILRALPQIDEPDLCESVLMINATGLFPDGPTLHAPIVRISEIPDVLCTRDEGGILSAPGAVEVINCLRGPDDAGLGGGVFLVIARQNAPTWEVLVKNGLLTNRAHTCGVIYRPYHLLGVEAPISLLSAGLLYLPTASQHFEPRADLVARTTENLPAGHIAQGAHTDPAAPFEPLIVPPTPLAADTPLPFYLAVGNRLRVDVPAGAILTGAMVVEPPGSRLWALRREQDRLFRVSH